MNRKFLIAILFLAVIGLIQNQAVAEPDFTRPMHKEFFDAQRPPMMNGAGPQNMGKRRPPNPEEFERRLKLSEEQKNIAKTQREEGVIKIKPILDKIKDNNAKIEQLRTSGASVEEITTLENEIKNLHRQAHELRKENMKDFESLLNDEQKKELQKMKDEGRRRFENEKMNR